MKFFLFLALFIPVTLHAQWGQVAKANDTITIINSGAATTWLRYGIGTTWIVKPYTSPKSFVVGSKEFTISPAPGVDPSTFVLQAFSQPNALPITVNGATVIIPAGSGNVTPPQPILSGTYALNATCVVNVTAMTVVCK